VRDFVQSHGDFAALLAAVRLVDVGKGRRGAVIAAPDPRGTPLVRATTGYAIARLPLPRGNNALVEHYTSAYRKMKPHSDLALDLDGPIAVYSHYRDPGRPSRLLRVTAKDTRETFDLPLAHDSVVEFSLATNRRYTHAILPNDEDNDWFGITFRTSKTFVVDGAIAGVPLTLATDEQRREFLGLRRRENEELDFAWPAISYTLNASDL